MASPYDNAGRISKYAFIVSTLTLFVLCLISVTARFYIRIRVQRQVGIDDAFLLFGTGCLISAMVLLFQFVNIMYTAEAFLFGQAEVQLTPSVIEDSYWYHKMSAVALILTWCSLVAVKFCFLFLFKKLVDRIRPMVIYWWVVVVYNAAVSLYGVSVYISACPYFYSLKALQCGQGVGLAATFNFSLSQLVLDVVGDLLILFIPCRLIWKIKVKWTQKLALASSLCLTVIVIICTICRIAGLKSDNRIDSVWETYWQYVAACTGLTMTAATAFRSLFLQHQIDNQRQRSNSGRWILYSRIREALRRSFTIRSWRSKSSSRGSSTLHASEDRDIELGKIERGTITGLRSYIHGYGREKATRASQVMRSQALDEVDEDDRLPLSDKMVASAMSSRGHDKMLAHEGSGKYGKMVARPEKVRMPLNDHKSPIHKPLPDPHDPGNLRSARTRSLKATPKSGLGVMSTFSCGKLNISAEVKVERYKEGGRKDRNVGLT